MCCVSVCFSSLSIQQYRLKHGKVNTLWTLTLERLSPCWFYGPRGPPEERHRTIMEQMIQQLRSKYWNAPCACWTKLHESWIFMNEIGQQRAGTHQEPINTMNMFNQKCPAYESCNVAEQQITNRRKDGKTLRLHVRRRSRTQRRAWKVSGVQENQ